MKHHKQGSTCWLKTSKSWTDIATFFKTFPKLFTSVIKAYCSTIPLSCNWLESHVKNKSEAFLKFL